jgi:hypothetical protein
VLICKTLNHHSAGSAQVIFICLLAAFFRLNNPRSQASRISSTNGSPLSVLTASVNLESFFQKSFQYSCYVPLLLESGTDSRKSRPLVGNKSSSYGLKKGVASPLNGFQNREAVRKTFFGYSFKIIRFSIHSQILKNSKCERFLRALLALRSEVWMRQHPQSGGGLVQIQPSP